MSKSSPNHSQQLYKERKTPVYKESVRHSTHFLSIMLDILAE